MDSGANIHSKYETTVSLKDLGIESEDWDAMSITEQEEVMRQVAFDRSEWGFDEITEI